MLIRILRFIVSILLLPACIALTISFYNGIVSIKYISEAGLIFILGALAYSVLHLLLMRLDFLYVFGHEFMHAIATFFSGGKATAFKVSGKGGSVKTTTPNLFVTLAPYLIPGYTVLIAAVYFLLSFFTDVDRFSSLFIFSIGFTLMFHLAYTAQSIRERQSDLIKSGYLFSISFLYIVNIIVAFSIITFLFNVSFLDFLSGFYERSKDFYYTYWRQLFL